MFKAASEHKYVVEIAARSKSPREVSIEQATAVTHAARPVMVIVFADSDYQLVIYKQLDQTAAAPLVYEQIES